jgi:hypothetical protein
VNRSKRYLSLIFPKEVESVNVGDCPKYCRKVIIEPVHAMSAKQPRRRVLEKMQPVSNPEWTKRDET